MRPDKSEYPHYFEPCIELLPQTGDVVDGLDQHAHSLPQLLAGVGEEGSLHRYQPEKWSIRQVVSHVTDTERTFQHRGFWILRAMPGELADYDGEDAMRYSEADGKTLAEHLADFAAVRSATVSLFRGLDDESWSRSGLVSGAHFTVRAIANLILCHQLHHERLLRERYGVGN